eukprot:TRINITY_DN30899_c0_g1_i1.p1 TRINITY_DN30899_c0_g1~~TRINITY_DN30899_c0_g1_i1.p1  ORF type:complete len:144 (+),score=22.93 TRINITY_DN30899_c0_g1_i1:39-470(+)
MLLRADSRHQLADNPSLAGTYMVTLLAWLGWISIQMYQTEFVAEEVYMGSSNPSSSNNAAYVEGVQAASLALVINALLMTLATYFIPTLISSTGEKCLWAVSVLLAAVLFESSVLIRSMHAKIGAGIWLALLGPVCWVSSMDT